MGKESKRPKSSWRYKAENPAILNQQIYNRPDRLAVKIQTAYSLWPKPSATLPGREPCAFSEGSDGWIGSPLRPKRWPRGLELGVWLLLRKQAMQSQANQPVTTFCEMEEDLENMPPTLILWLCHWPTLVHLWWRQPAMAKMCLECCLEFMAFLVLNPKRIQPKPLKFALVKAIRLNLSKIQSHHGSLNPDIFLFVLWTLQQTTAACFGDEKPLCEGPSSH